MPTYQVPNQGTAQTMSHPVGVAIVNQVLSFLGLNKRVKDVRYYSAAGSVRVPNTAMGEDGDEYASFQGTGRIFVEAETDENKEEWLRSRPNRVDAAPDFADKELGVYIAPLLQGFVSTIKIRIANHSLEIIRQTRTSLLRRIAQLEDGIQHEVSFAASLSPVCLATLNQVWMKRETKGGYNQDFLPYLSEHSSQRLITTSDGSGTKVDLMYKYNMQRVNGYFQVTDIPERPTWQDDKSNWEFIVEYKAYYDLPTEMYLTFPIVVHNQFLQREFIIAAVPPKNDRDSLAKLTTSQIASELTEFGHASGMNLKQDLIINTPSIDRYYPKCIPTNTATAFISLLLYQEDNKYPLFNLGALDGIHIDRDILDFIKKGEYEHLTTFGQSFFYLHMYENDRMMEGKLLRVDKDLNVWNTVPLNIRRTYRVRFAILADLTVINKTAFDRMWEFPDVVIKTLSCINDAIRDHTDFFASMKRGGWAPWMMSPVWMMLNGFKASPRIPISFDEAAAGVLKPHQSGDITNVSWGGGYKPSMPDTAYDLGDEFYVPTQILKNHQLNNLGMRTVQIQSIIVHRLEN